MSKEIFSDSLSGKQPLLLQFAGCEIVVINKHNQYFYEYMTVQEFDDLGLDSRNYIILPVKVFNNMRDQNYCTLQIDNKRAELSSFDELKGVYVSLPK